MLTQSQTRQIYICTVPALIHVTSPLGTLRVGVLRSTTIAWGLMPGLGGPKPEWITLQQYGRTPSTVGSLRLYRGTKTHHAITCLNMYADSQLAYDCLHGLAIPTQHHYK